MRGGQGDTGGSQRAREVEVAVVEQRAAGSKRHRWEMQKWFILMLLQ